jgi:hypothetical protein
VVCGADHTLLLTDKGQVYSCGLGTDGQTGWCPQLNAFSNNIVPCATGFIFVYNSNERSLSVLFLGQGHFDSVGLLSQVKGDIEGENIVHIASRMDCVLAVSGNVWAFRILKSVEKSVQGNLHCIFHVYIV